MEPLGDLKWQHQGAGMCWGYNMGRGSLLLTTMEQFEMAADISENVALRFKYAANRGME